MKMSSLFLSVCWYSYTLDVTTLDHLKNSLIDWIILLPLISSDSVYLCGGDFPLFQIFVSSVWSKEIGFHPIHPKEFQNSTKIMVSSHVYNIAGERSKSRLASNQTPDLCPLPYECWDYKHIITPS